MQFFGRRRVSGQFRYAVPAAVLVAVGVGSGVPAMSGASSPPKLPSLSVQQLLTDVAQAKVPELSGTLTWAPNLGLSGLSTLEQELGGTSMGSTASGGGFDPLTLLGGNYDVKVWLGGPKEERLALITGPDSEVDLVRNANQVWLWDSSTQRVDHFIGPPTSSSASSPASGSGPVATPQQIAANILQNLSATTALSMGEPLYVAGQPAYQLVLTPKEATTLSNISIAVGSRGPLLGVPLQVAVNAKGVNPPPLELSFTSLNLGAPAPSEFSFVAPSGSKVVTHEIGPAPTQPQGLGWLPTSIGTSGTGWATVLHGKSSNLAGALGQAPLGAVARQVNVAGQEARLFTSYLLNVLVMPDGQFYAGFVAPPVLKAAASQGA